MKHNKFITIFLILILIFPISVFGLDEEENKEELDNNKISVKLEACVDGDTAKFKLDDDSVIKARFLAIDTPETVHPTKDIEAYGKDASELTCKILTDATDIVLEYDEASTKVDKYGRELVWVFADGVLVQDSLIAKGYAKVAYLYGDYKYTSVLKSSEEIAKASKIGIWNDEVINTIPKEADNQEEAEEKKENSNPIIAFFDNLLASIFDIINDILDSILQFLDNVL